MLFYVDWCPHCKTAKPEWESLKSEYDGKSINGYTINFMEYNCTTESDEVSQLMDKYNIEGYPTIKLLKDGTVIEYDAKPTKDTIIQFSKPLSWCLFSSSRAPRETSLEPTSCLRSVFLT